jgi:prolyl-tRNA synthetase
MHFLFRSREFLWQEGHTAYATKEEADEEVRSETTSFPRFRYNSFLDSIRLNKVILL